MYQYHLSRPNLCFLSNSMIKLGDLVIYTVCRLTYCYVAQFGWYDSVLVLIAKNNKGWQFQFAIETTSIQ